MELPTVCKPYTFNLLPSRTTFPVSPWNPKCKFRLLSWNLLAQCLVKRDMYPSTLKETLRWKHRFPLIKHYLTVLQPEVLCLQEVDPMDQVSSMLKEEGYTVANVQKLNGRHSCFIAWKTSLFQCLKQVPVLLKPLNEAIPDASTLGNTAIVTWLNHLPSGQSLIISNHHLYWSPHGSYLRLHQLQVLLNYLLKENTENVPVFLCGDFNFSPTSPEYRVLTKRSIEEFHFQRLRQSNKETNSELFDLLQLFYPFPKCHSVYGDYQGRLETTSLTTSDLTSSTVMGEPEFTNYTEAYKGTLDYIFWMEDKLNRVWVHTLLKMPEATALETEEKGLPNIHFPSDHLPIMAELEILPCPFPPLENQIKEEMC